MSLSAGRSKFSTVHHKCMTICSYLSSSSRFCYPGALGLALLTLSSDKILVNWYWFSNVASDWLAANQKLHLKIMINYPCFYLFIYLFFFFFFFFLGGGDINADLQKMPRPPNGVVEPSLLWLFPHDFDVDLSPFDDVIWCIIDESKVATNIFTRPYVYVITLGWY